LPDGSDVRVTDGSGTLALPFWVEAWNAVAQRATIWVKVPSVPAGGTTVYLYYGNPAATMAGSGAATFDIYDGFEALAVGSPPASPAPGVFTWTPGGAVTAVSSPTRQGARSLQQQNYTTLTATFAGLSQGVVGTWLQRVSTSPGDDDIYLYTNGTLVGTVGLGGSGRLHYFDGSFHDTAVAWTPGTWYLVTATFDATQRHFDFAVFDATLTLLVRVPGIAFAGGAGSLNAAMLYTSSAFTGDAYADDFRILRWTGAEVADTVGAEETR
jgi:hypothetical protein